MVFVHGISGTWNERMPYLIDGHNLIPKMGLQLAAVDDELELIAALKEYSLRFRKAIEVYFDGAPAGHSGVCRFGQVTAHFVSQHSSADSAIMGRLRKLGGDARNWVVVSSDREVLRAAMSARARTETSGQFAGRLRRKQADGSTHETKPPLGADAGLSEEEIKDWLDIFKQGHA
jgi:predicted RNA-binding protein with PIN domain